VLFGSSATKGMTDSLMMTELPGADPAYLAYLFAFAAAATGCLLGAWRACQAGPTEARRGLAGLLGASGLWALFHVGVLLSPSLPLKTVFYVAGLTVGFLTVWAWVWFCSSYSGRSLHKGKAARWAALAVFVAVTLTKLTNLWHGLYFTAEWSAVPFRHLAVDHHVLYWITSALSYALAATGFFMLAEPLRNLRVGTGRLAGLFALTALPLGANAIGYTTPYLLDLSYEPIGVAAFAIGVLFVWEEQFEEAGQAGRLGRPAVVLSEDGQVRNYNEAATRLFSEFRGERGAIGRSLEEVLPQLAEILAEETLAEETMEEQAVETETIGKEAGDEGGVPSGKLLEVEGSGGEIRYFRTTETSFQRGTGRLVALDDVTERELRRQNRESRLEVLFKGSPDMIDVHDAEGNLLEANTRFFEKTGYREEDLPGLKVWDIDSSICPEEAAGLWEGMEAGDQRQIEGRYRRKDGSAFPVEVHVRRLRLEGKDRFVAISRDVTQRKQAREQLKTERDRLETLFESLPTPVVRCRADDREAKITDANLAFEKTFGIGGGEAEGKNLNALLVPEESREEAAEIDRQALREGREEREVRRLTAEGLRDFRLQVAGRQPEEGPPEVFAIYTDITERKAREKTLRSLRRKYEGLLQGAPDAIFVADGETGRITEANRAAATLLELSREELVGRHFTEVHPSEKEGLYREVFERYTCSEERFKTDRTLSDGSQILIQTSSGETVPVEINATAMEVDGRPFGIAIFRDITEQKRREKALKQRQEKIEALYESTRQLLRAKSREEIAAEVHGVLQDVFAYPFGYTAFVEDGTIVPKKINARGDYDMPRPEPRPVGGDTVAARALEASEAVVVSDTRNLSNEIDYGDLHSVAGLPIGDRGVVIAGRADSGDFDRSDLRLLEVLGGYATLVLDHLRREKALHRAKEEAEEAKRMQSAFLANMSHEIRTPLTSIIGFAEALGTESSEMELPEGSALPKYASLIENGGKRLLQTLEGVLNLSKLEAGQMRFSSGPVSLASQTRRTVEELGPEAQEKDIDLQLQVEPTEAEADEGGVQIVLRNLLSNAIKYTERGGSVWLRTYQEEDWAVLEVEDTGIGMEPEVANRLFEPFRQASEGWGRKYEGTGVGLAVTKEAAEQMGGTVVVETEQGEGSRFTVWLPQVDSQGGAEPQGEIDPQEGAGPKGEAREASE